MTETPSNPMPKARPDASATSDTHPTPPALTAAQMAEQVMGAAALSGFISMTTARIGTVELITLAKAVLDAQARIEALEGEVSTFRRGFGAISLAVAAIDGESDNTPWQDVVERINRMGRNLGAACRLADERGEHCRALAASRDHDRAEYADRLTAARTRAEGLEGVIREYLAALDVASNHVMRPDDDFASYEPIDARLDAAEEAMKAALTPPPATTGEEPPR